MKRFVTLILALLLTAAALPAAAEADDTRLILDRVVILSRHNLRSPLTGRNSAVSQVTPHAWFAWTSEPGELSLRGGILETAMGQYFRQRLEREGFFPANYVPEEGAVRFYANGHQRTQATARFFSAGLLPMATVPVECRNGLNVPDGTFLPLITFMNDRYEAAVRAEIEARGGGSLQGYADEVADAARLIIDILDMDESPAWNGGALEERLYAAPSLRLEKGREPRADGGIRLLCSLADALVLQRYEEPDDLKAAFGHEITEEDWRTVGRVLAVYEDMLFAAPSLAVNLAHPILAEVYAEMNTEGRKLAFLCGHDTTITSFLAALEAEAYTLPGAIEATTPIGTKVVFTRWLDPEGRAFWKVSLVCLSAEQMRTIRPLTPEDPPVIVPVSFAGLAADAEGLIPEADLMDRFERAIGAYDALAEEYGEASGEAAPEDAA